jgi:G3E family GTPase
LKCSEFGNVEVDSQLAKENAISTKEILNGCLVHQSPHFRLQIENIIIFVLQCCTLTGRLGDAMQEIMAEYKPQLLIVETSGSAFPAPIAWEIRRLQAEGVLNVSLDALINVIDIANFRGYEDKSYTAKVQAKYTDLILINKHELLTEQQYDDAMDDVFELNPDTPKV